MKFREISEGKNNDPRQAADLLYSKLDSNEDGCLDNFVDALQIRDITAGSAIMKMLGELGPLDKEDISVIKDEYNYVMKDIDDGVLSASINTLLRMGMLEESSKGLTVEPIALKAVMKADNLQ